MLKNARNLNRTVKWKYISCSLYQLGMGLLNTATVKLVEINYGILVDFYIH
jgi:hypothetical protein